MSCINIDVLKNALYLVGGSVIVVWIGFVCHRGIAIRCQSCYSSECVMSTVNSEYLLSIVFFQLGVRDM